MTCPCPEPSESNPSPPTVTNQNLIPFSHLLVQATDFRDGTCCRTNITSPLWAHLYYCIHNKQVCLWPGVRIYQIRTLAGEFAAVFQDSWNVPVVLWDGTLPLPLSFMFRILLANCVCLYFRPSVYTIIMDPHVTAPYSGGPAYKHPPGETPSPIKFLLAFAVAKCNLGISSVGISTGYGLDDRIIGVRFPASAGNFSLRHRAQTGSGAHPASYPMGTGSSFPGAKATEARNWQLTF
jgi:hypothetical protein